MIRLSIIIPFYNVERYIAECLDSVFNQDIPLEEYEVICVNDASPDHSRDIVLDYMKRYPNLRLVEHDHNRKLGAARNTGRSVAKGTYIWNVDSDDKIAPNCLGEMLKVCEENKLDVLEFGLKSTDGQSLSLSQIPRDEQIYTGLAYLEKYHINTLGTICGIWRKLYRKGFLEENSICSPEINMGEDEPFAIEVFTKANRMMYYDQENYIYRFNQESLTGTNKKTRSATQLYEHSFVCARYMDKALQSISLKIKPEILYKLQQMISYNIGLWPDNSYPQKNVNQYWSLCRKDFFKNIFAFRYLSHKMTYKYLLHILICNFAKYE